MSGFGGAARGKKNKSKNQTQLNFQKWFNQAIYFHQIGNLRNAESTYKKLIAAGIEDSAVFCNLGVICKNSGRIKEALDYYSQALKFEPDDPKIYANIGNLYRLIGNLQQALDFTLKSLEFDNDSSTTHLNLGSIYRDLGQTDQALAATLRSISLDADNLDAHCNLQSIAELININSSDRQNVERAFEILLRREDFFHRRLCPLFIQLFLDKINTAAQYDSLISGNNPAVQELASDWRFIKALTLLTPPHQDIETFLTRLRKELLAYVVKNNTFPLGMNPLIISLSIQCFLNEYVYYQSGEEQEQLSILVSRSMKSSDLLNKYLPILSCYVSVDQLINETITCHDQITFDSSFEELISIQLKEVEVERGIKTQLAVGEKITNVISLKVKEMYEQNPYPRYRFSDYTYPQLSRPIAEFISNETTLSRLVFSDELLSSSYSAKVLIAGCGTGNQIINATRYKDADLTAIDISLSSLAYAIRKSRDYNIDHVRFEHLDILNLTDLHKQFDVIECSGVLHHMDNPADGLSALNRQLKPGGYMKIGLYSSLARATINLARNSIRSLGITASADNIRAFRKSVFDGEFKDLKKISILINDFYTLSECRDLCFHIQEHQFTVCSLQEMLDAENLVFCGFMLPDSILAVYREMYPGDRDAISLSNWGEFEQKYPSTFQSMYQFWVQKPSS